MAELALVIDAMSAVAPYEQVKDAITAQVDSEALSPGFRLPPVRTLATDLGIAANTVARAYRELESAGVVETRGRAGTFVSGRGVERAARTAALSYVETVRTLGLSDAAALEQVRRVLTTD